MKKLLSLAVLLFCAATAGAQSNPYAPYKAAVDAAVTNKATPDSITAAQLGGVIKNLADSTYKYFTKQGDTAAMLVPYALKTTVYTKTQSDAAYVPQARTITINGVTFDLSANRAFTVSGSGAVTDTTSLSARIDGRVKYTDTAAMLRSYTRINNSVFDISQYGAIANAAANNDSVIAKWRASGKRICYVPPGGQYNYATSIVLDSGRRLTGADMQISKVHYTGTSHAVICGLSNGDFDNGVKTFNNGVADIWIDGNGGTSGHSFEGGIKMYGAPHSSIRNVKLTNFGGDGTSSAGGGAIIIYNSNLGYIGNGTSIHNIIIDSCKAGLNYAQRAEYNYVDGAFISHTGTHIHIVSGNNIFANIQSTGNDTGPYASRGLVEESGYNNGHNTYNGCTFNHHYKGFSLTDVSNAELFNGCQFYEEAGGNDLTNTVNVRFMNTIVADGGPTVLTNNTGLYFNGYHPDSVALISGETLTNGTLAGNASKNGTGSATTFTVTHGAGYTPSQVFITPTSTAAAAPFIINNKTATTFDIVYTSAPASGTNNVTFSWQIIR